MASIDIAMQSTSEEILEKVETGVTVGLRTPVNITGARLTGSGEKFTGTGKGILQVGAANISIDLVIDGTEWSTNGRIIGHHSRFEFTENFQVILKETGTVYCNAVFY